MHLLLRRGANPNASLAPMPVIFFAAQFGDVGMVRLLIERGADPNCHMSSKVRAAASASKRIPHLLLYAICSSDEFVNLRQNMMMCHV